MKKICVVLMVLLMLLGLASCEGGSSETEEKVLECDGCGAEVEVDQSKDADPDEDWIIYCEECAEKLEE